MEATDIPNEDALSPTTEHAANNSKGSDGGEQLLKDVPPTTLVVYTRFYEIHSVEMTTRQFVGLCAYLVAILRWGYTIHVDDLDHFITYHDTFLAWLPTFEAREIESARPSIPSYHQWFLEEIDRAHEIGLMMDLDGESILTEAVLREMWRESPLIFLRAQLSLECIALAVQRDASEAALLESLQSS